MARLTRTQKFAELRDSLSNDKESSLQTKDLSIYEDRLNSITELLSPLTQEKPVVATPVEEDPKYTWTEFKDTQTPVEDLIDSFKNDELEQQIHQITEVKDAHAQINENSARKETQTPISEPVEEIRIASADNSRPLIQEPEYQPVPDEAPIINIRTDQNYTPIIDESQYMASLNEDDYRIDETPVYTAPVIEEATPAITQQETPIIEQAKEENNSFLGYYHPTQEVEDLYKEAENKVQETPASEPAEQPLNIEVVDKAFETVSHEEAPATYERETAEFADNHAIDQLDDFVNSFVSETINEVGEYNKNNGDMTVSQLASNMVNEIRHPNEVIEEPQVPEVEEEPESDEEFTNTVSMEIDKIMEEISHAEEETELEPIPEILEAPETPEIVEVPEVPEETIVVEEHPVLAKALEDEGEDVVEIKNITELEAEPIRDTVSNTIPFVVTSSDDEEEIEDDDEEGSNTILNIILIVLIIVLVAVLGLIVFYILKTKGVI